MSNGRSNSRPSRSFHGSPATGSNFVRNSVDRLSVGQQQRVAVARALAAKPALVLADEPTASLDPENAVAAMDLIQDACRANGAALLCTSHDPAMRARFTRIDTVDAFVAKVAA
ncbi:MAG: ATP-binding cassette domain-containing protein [Phycisphaerales bacterium]